MLTRISRGTWAAPFDALFDVRRELDRVFDNGDWTGWRSLATDVIETPDDVRVTMEIPGMDPGEIDITLENNVLRVSGEKRTEREEGEGTEWRLSERRYGRFERSFALPRRVLSEDIDATYENGVLTVVVPKREESKPRRIEVRGASPREVGSAGESNE